MGSHFSEKRSKWAAGYGVIAFQSIHAIATLVIKVMPMSYLDQYKTAHMVIDSTDDISSNEVAGRQKTQGSVRRLHLTVLRKLMLTA